MSSPLPAVEKSAARGGRRARNARTTPRDRGLRPRSLGVGLGVQGAQGAPGPPNAAAPPGPRFFYVADDAILEESPGAAGDSVQGG